MRLSLSSAAAPDATLADLLAACARRGLSAVELVAGQGHGTSCDLDDAAVAAIETAANEAGVAICAIYSESLSAEDAESYARLAARLGAPLVVEAGGVPPQILPTAAAAFHDAGAELLLAYDTEAAAVELLQRPRPAVAELEAVGLAWEIRPEHDDPALVQRVLNAAGSRLRYVRLHGGGPEAAEQTGRGVGALMGRLALARYSGPLVLTPSTPRYRYAWQAWLGRAGGWGCGSKSSDPSLVTFQNRTITAGDHS